MVLTGRLPERLRTPTGSLFAPWLTRQSTEPVAAPAAKVAELLGVTVEEVHAAQVAPYTRADGTPVWSVHLVGVALGVRKPHRHKQRATRQAHCRRGHSLQDPTNVHVRPNGRRMCRACRRERVRERRQERKLERRGVAASRSA